MSTSFNKSSNIVNARRFSDDQIKSLETMFRTESRPELRLKHHLANKLGLQPRQVAIWFQNKRARSKSKEIEEEYAVLKSSYDKLVVEFDALRKEHQALLTQLEKLRMMGSERDREFEDSKNQITLAEINGDEIRIPPCSDVDRKDEFPEEKADIMTVDALADASLASTETGCSFEPYMAFRDHAGGCIHWWDC